MAPRNDPALADALTVLLDEAGNRCSARDAAIVISSVLDDLAHSHPAMQPTAQSWAQLVALERQGDISLS